MKEKKLSHETTVLFQDVRVLKPALDVNPEETIMVTVTLPAIITKFNKKSEEVGKKPDMVFFVISSSTFDQETKQFKNEPEIFECKLEEFTKRGWFSRIPITPISQRWSAEKISEYLEGKSPNVDPYKIYTMILDEWNFFIDFVKLEGADIYNTVWDIGTYFHILFYYYPYIKFGGLKGVGKSKAGAVHAAIGFNGELFAKATPASIYRFAGDTRGVQVVDEQERLSSESDEMMAYYQVFNSGFQSNGAVIVTNTDSMKVDKWPTYCPKVIIAIWGMRETLADRADEIILLRSTNQTITNREVPPPELDRWRPIRDNLYLLMLQNWIEVKEIYDNLTNEYEFEGRRWNLAKPLIAVARFIDRYAPERENNIEKTLVDFIKKCNQTKLENTQDTNSAIILRALYDLLKNHSHQPDNYLFSITVKEVREKAVDLEGEWITDHLKHKTVAGILKNLDLYKESNRSGRTGSYRFKVSLDEVISTANRYDIILEETEHTEQIERTEGVSGKVEKNKGGKKTLQSILSSVDSERSGSSVVHSDNQGNQNKGDSIS